MSNFNRNLQVIQDEIKRRIDPSSRFATSVFSCAAKSLCNAIGAYDAFVGFESLHEHELDQCLGGGNYGIAFSLKDLPEYALKIGFMANSIHPAIEEFAKTRTTEKDFSSMQFEDLFSSHANVLSFEEMDDRTLKAWANSPGCIMTAVQSGKAFVQVTELVEQNESSFIRILLLQNFIATESRKVGFMHDIWIHSGKKANEKNNFDKARTALGKKIKLVVDLALKYGRIDPIENILKRMAAPKVVSLSSSSIYDSIHNEIVRWEYVKDPAYDIDAEIKRIFQEWAFNPKQLESELFDVSDLLANGQDVHPGNLGIRKNQGKIVGFDHLLAESKNYKRGFARIFSKLFVQDLKKIKSAKGPNAKIVGSKKGIEFEIKDEGIDISIPFNGVIPYSTFFCNAYRHKLFVKLGKNMSSPVSLINVFGDEHLIQNFPAGFQTSPGGNHFIVIISRLHAKSIDEIYHSSFSTFSHELEHLVHSMKKNRENYFNFSAKNPKSILNFDPATASVSEIRFISSLSSSSFLKTFKNYLSPTEFLSYTKQVYAIATRKKIKHRKPFLESIATLCFNMIDNLVKCLAADNLILEFDKAFSVAFASYSETVIARYWKAVEQDIIKMANLFRSLNLPKDKICQEIVLILFSFLFFAFVMNAKRIYGMIEITQNDGTKKKVLRINHLLSQKHEMAAFDALVSRVPLSFQKILQSTKTLIYGGGIKDYIKGTIV